MSGVAILLPAGSRVVARVRGAIRRLSLSILLIVVLGARYEVVTVLSRTSCTTVYVHAQISILLYEALVADSLLRLLVRMGP